MTVTIWARNRLHVSAGYNEGGDLVISGQDLNGWNGRDEYEYWITVTAADFPTLRTALPGPEDTDLLELLRVNAERLVAVGERTLLTALGIETGFACWP